jgi:hypothetical protein
MMSIGPGEDPFFRERRMPNHAALARQEARQGRTARQHAPPEPKRAVHAAPVDPAGTRDFAR